jgi:hypothetical protein
MGREMNEAEDVGVVVDEQHGWGKGRERGGRPGCVQCGGGEAR